MADVKKRYIASVSFGKDSLAMLLLILETGQPLDEVVFFDTGMEFQAVYDIRDTVKALLEEKQIQFTELTPPRPFLYDMLYREKTKRDGSIVCGDGWCGGPCRWGTYVKQRVLDKHTDGCHIYVGLAADEEKRLGKLEVHKSSPIADAGMTESDCLQYCYDRGFFWEENGVRLYDILDRVSCWCCRNKNLKELRNIYHQLPNYWGGLKQLQESIPMPMKGTGKSVFDLERRFAIEDEWLAAGRKINTKAFYNALK